jgi:hypothetical protein
LGGCADLVGAARGEIGSVVDGAVAAGLAVWGERRRVAGARRRCGAEKAAGCWGEARVRCAERCGRGGCAPSGAEEAAGWWCGNGGGDGVQFERGEVKGCGFERGEMKGNRPSYVLLKFWAPLFHPKT